MNDQAQDLDALRKRIRENEKLLDKLEKAALRQFNMGSLNVDGAELKLRAENIELKRLIGKIDNPPANTQ